MKGESVASVSDERGLQRFICIKDYRVCAHVLAKSLTKQRKGTLWNHPTKNCCKRIRIFPLFYSSSHDTISYRHSFIHS